MSKYIKNILVLAFVLAYSVNGLFAQSYNDDAYFEATSQGSGAAHIKAMILYSEKSKHIYSGLDYDNKFCGKSGIASADSSASYLYYQLRDKDKKIIRSGRIMSYFTTYMPTSANRNEICLDADSRGWGCATKMLNKEDEVGVIQVTNAYKSSAFANFTYQVYTDNSETKTKTITGVTEWTQHALKYSHANGDCKSGEQPLYLEFDWFYPGIFATQGGVSIDIYLVTKWYTTNNTYKSNSGSNVYALVAGSADKSTVKYNLGTIQISSPTPPTLTPASFMPKTADNQNSIGYAMSQFISTSKVSSYKVFINGKEVSSKQMSGDSYTDKIDIPTTDSVQNLYVQANVQYSSSSDGSVTTNVKVNTEQIQVAPLHKIHNFKVETNKKIGPYGIYTDDGSNKISWVIKNTSVTDMAEGDVFLLERATKPDFSDAVYVGTTYNLEKTKGGDSTYVVIDSSYEAKHMKYGKILYYRVSRGIATVWGLNDTTVYAKGFAAKNQIESHCFLPLINAEAIVGLSADTIFPTAKRAKTYDVDRAVNIFIPLQRNIYNDPSVTYSSNFRWDPKARIFLTRTYIAKNSKQTVEVEIPTDSISTEVLKVNSTSISRLVVHYTDYLLATCVDVEYGVRIDTTESTLYSCEDNAYPRGVLSARMIQTETFYNETPPSIKTITASDSLYKNYVLVRWNGDATGVDGFVVQRENPVNKVWSDIALVQGEGVYYDWGTIPGREYKYRVAIKYSCESFSGKMTEPSASDAGSADRYGIISGSVKSNDGTGLVGVKVSLQVKDKQTYYAFTDKQGNFVKDSIEYDVENGSAVTVSATSQTGLLFVTTTNDPANPHYIVNLRAHDADQKNYDFYLTSYRNVTGRVLYNKSTVPVPYASFYITTQTYPDGYTLKTPSGDEIQSDLQGYFSFQVPNDVTSIRIVKPYHKFTDDGYLVVNNSRVLSLDDDLREIRFYDTSKATLIGRVVGGTIQGTKPLGFDLSTNNIGDSVKIVLELEGDNISHLVHDPNDLSITEKDTVFNHVSHGHSTSLSMTRRRITIRPDAKSGEFRVELFPARYKIVQLSAEGYSTLLPAKQALPVIDLSQNFDRGYRDSIQNSNNESIVYSDTLRYIYHSAPSLTYSQLLWGQELKHYGIENVNIVRGSGKVLSVKTAVVDSTNWKTRYLFGNPLFVPGNYDFLISAHEDYYYNNNKLNRHESVPLVGNVKIYNDFKSASESQLVALNNQGQAKVTIPMINSEFTVGKDAALRTVNMTMDYNGEYVDAKPLVGLITGDTEVAGGIMQKLSSAVIVNDIIRDPYGANSYAYIEKGTKYSTEYKSTIDWKFGINLSLYVGTAGTFWVGFGAGVVSSFNTGGTLSYPVVFSHHMGDVWSYEFTTTDRISTSSEPSMVGANADVYLGTNVDVCYTKQKGIQVIDDSTYKSIAAALKSGEAVLLAQGYDSIKRENVYLVVQDIIKFGTNISGNFAYSQKHILNTIIPDLQAKRDALILTGMTTSQVLARATALGKPLYLSTVPLDDSAFGATENVKQIVPSSVKVSVNEVDEYNKLISTWLSAIYSNEQVKLNARSGKGTSYDVGSNGHYSVSETASHSHTRSDYWNFPTSFSLGGSGTAPIREGSAPNSGKANEFSSEISSPGISVLLSVSPELGFSYQRDNGRTNENTRTAGFEIATSSGSYTNQTVYRVTNEDWKKESKSDRDDAYSVDSDKKEEHLSNDYVFFQNGGATHCPYEPEEVSLFNDKKIISNKTLKIENPKLTLNKYIASEVAGDEAAIFSLRLSNESEILGSAYSGAPIAFSLCMDDPSNSKGLKIYIDGMPLTDGRIFYLNPGESITKIMEVRRGVGYDFEDIKLTLFSDCNPALVYDDVTFSVHYIPTSSPVDIVSPDNKWVLNTLSQKDQNGYYIPVTISGFDINYENFDHIELQYKLSTEGESRWVTQCSYYAKDSLMKLASGNRELIKVADKIDNIKFYGERDPMEQHYDLRAVTYCRHGNSFITKSSPIISGIKDTRLPRTFGKPTPTNGILTYEDVIKIPFSENIAGQYLDKDNNFQVLGTTKSCDFTTGTSLNFPGLDSAMAISVSERSLIGMSFTFDMLVQCDDINGSYSFVTHSSDSHDNFMFGVLDGKYLVAVIDSIMYKSQEMSTNLGSFRRVACIYNRQDSIVHFYVGNQEVTDKVSSKISGPLYSGNGKFKYGGAYISNMSSKLGIRPFKGQMLEAHIWSKALGQDEIDKIQMQPQTGYESGLLAYYPMRQTRGNVAVDKAHGANLALKGLSWNYPKGMSMHLIPSESQPKGDGVILNPKYASVPSSSDMSIMFWYKPDRNTPYAEGDTVALFGTGIQVAKDGKSGSGLMIGLAQGSPFVRSGGHIVSSSASYNDLDWHHIALTINRATNQMCLYVDEQLVAVDVTENIDGISGSKIELGSCSVSYLDEIGGISESDTHHHFKGYIDHFSIWQSALPLYFISEYSNNSPTGSELSLQAYAPFHYQKANSHDIYEMAECPYNMIVKRNEGKVVENAKLDTLITTTNFGVYDSDMYAPVNESSPIGKIDYDFISKDNELIINILTPEAQINKQRVYVSVREVEDLNGNPTSSVITVPVFLELNRLRWESKSVEFEVFQGVDLTFKMKAMNRCGADMQYIVSTDVDWLYINNEQGTLHPTDEVYIEFSISRGLNPGTYTAPVYLTDEANLSETFMVKVNVKAVRPDWSVDKSLQNTNMNLVGVVYKNRSDNAKDGYVISTNTEDIVAAFIDSVCVGTANIINNKLESSNLYMTIYGNSNLEKRNIKFRYWDSQSGNIYVLDPQVASGISYNKNTCSGCVEPIAMYPISKNEVQLIEINRGWNWISVNLDMSGNLNKLDHVFIANGLFQPGDIIKDHKDAYAASYSKAKRWEGSLKSIKHSNIYMLYSQTGGNLEIIGDELTKRTLKLSSGWNPLPYLCSTTQSIDYALADYYSNASVGDIVKSYDEGFAVFTKNNRWVGSLQFMRPGRGYYLYRTGTGTVDFKYVNTSNIQESSTRKSYIPEDETDNNMPIVAVISGMKVERGDILEAWVDDKKVGSISTADAVYFFLSTYAKEGSQLRFALVRDEQVIGTSKTVITYSSAFAKGTYENPVVIDMSESDGVLLFDNEDSVYKIIEDNQVIIVRNGTKYTILGVEKK